jgi:hypothetical protein
MFSFKFLIALVSTALIVSTAADPDIIGKWTLSSMTPEECTNPKSKEDICNYLCIYEGEWSLKNEVYEWKESIDELEFELLMNQHTESSTCRCNIMGGAIDDNKLEIATGNSIGSMEVKDNKAILSFTTSESLTCTATYEKTKFQSFEGGWKMDAIYPKICETISENYKNTTAPEGCFNQCFASGEWVKNENNLSWKAANEPTAGGCNCSAFYGEVQGSRLVVRESRSGDDETFGFLSMTNDTKPVLTYGGAEGSDIYLCYASYEAIKDDGKNTTTDDTKNSSTPTPAPTPSNTASVLSAASTFVVVALTALVL